MNLKLNPDAVSYALQLVNDGKYRINSIWSDNKPNETKFASYSTAHGQNEAARWYLATDLDAPEGSPERLVFPVGDFDNVHQTGLLAAKQRAQLAGNGEIVDAADNILDLFDRMNAC